jgi:Tol biopolymer transport system component
VEGNAAVNVFLRNLLTGSIKLISADRITKKGVGGSVPSISEDGSRVAFCSFSSNLTTADNNNLWDIFLYDSHFPELKRISVTATGGERNQGTESASRVVAPAISGNGWYIAYATTASNVVPGDTNGSQDIFVCEVETGKTVRVEPGNNGAQANADCPVAQGERPAISYNGNWIAFTSKASNLAVPADNIILYSLLTKETKPVTAINGGSVARPAISGNGGYVIFGAGSQLDTRFRSSGLFAAYLGISRCRECAE